MHFHKDGIMKIMIVTMIVTMKIKSYFKYLVITIIIIVITIINYLQAVIWIYYQIVSN